MLIILFLHFFEPLGQIQSNPVKAGQTLDSLQLDPLLFAIRDFLYAKPTLETPSTTWDGWDGLGRSWDARKSENRPCLPALGRWDGCTPPSHPLPLPPHSRLAPGRNQLHLSAPISTYLSTVTVKATPALPNPFPIVLKHPEPFRRPKPGERPSYRKLCLATASRRLRTCIFWQMLFT